MGLFRFVFTALTAAAGWLRAERLCRYCHTMKKGENAAESVRECAADLWRKGATLTWPVPQDNIVTGAVPVPCSSMRLDESCKIYVATGGRVPHKIDNKLCQDLAAQAVMQAV